jgi:hypothetical protein
MNLCRHRLQCNVQSHTSSYAPPEVGAGTGFGDVPPDYWTAAWIKQLAAEGITAGCGSGNYCPETAVTRAQMGVFLVKTFGAPQRLKTGIVFMVRTFSVS